MKVPEIASKIVCNECKYTGKHLIIKKGFLNNKFFLAYIRNQHNSFGENVYRIISFKTSHSNFSHQPKIEAQINAFFKINKVKQGVNFVAKTRFSKFSER